MICVKEQGIDALLMLRTCVHKRSCVPVEEDVWQQMSLNLGGNTKTFRSIVPLGRVGFFILSKINY